MKKGALALVPLVVLCGGVFLVASLSKEQKQPSRLCFSEYRSYRAVLTATIPYVQYPHGMGGWLRLRLLELPIGIWRQDLWFPCGPSYVDGIRR